MNHEVTAGHGVSNDEARVLDHEEVRVLAVLAEKEQLTPDAYPMSLNGIINGCNQLSSRDPVMSLSEDAVRETLHRLMEKKLVTEVSQAGGRVPKYEHRMRIKWTLEQDKVAVLTLLMLRGPQTAGEIRNRSGRMHTFATIAEVESGLQFLIDKFPPLVARLPRAAGTKEARYMHLLSGEEIPEQTEPGVSRSAAIPGTVSRDDRIAELEQEIARLRDEFTALSAQFADFRKQFE